MSLDDHLSGIAVDAVVPANTLREIKRCYELVKYAEPVIHVIKVSSLVPSGRVWRQYDTLGRMIAWMSREEFDRIEVVARKAHDLDYIAGIPVELLDP